MWASAQPLELLHNAGCKLAGEQAHTFARACRHASENTENKQHNGYKLPVKPSPATFDQHCKSNSQTFEMIWQWIKQFVSSSKPCLRLTCLSLFNRTQGSQPLLGKLTWLRAHCPGGSLSLWDGQELLRARVMSEYLDDSHVLDTSM